MADENKQNAGTEIEKSIVGTYSKFEHYYHDNRQKVNYVVGGVLLAILLIIGGRFWVANRENEAQKKMFWAQQMLEADSFKLALNGSGKNLGFLKVKDKYGWTKAANLCNFYAGVCYLNSGDFKKAEASLDAFKAPDDIMTAAKKELLGDIAMEMNQTDKGLDLYKQAAAATENEAFAPRINMKAGQAFEVNKKYAEAKEFYQKAKELYQGSTNKAAGNGGQINMLDAFIARCDANM